MRTQLRRRAAKKMKSERGREQCHSGQVLPEAVKSIFMNR
jgi:hypothetical protein